MTKPAHDKIADGLREDHDMSPEDAARRDAREVAEQFRQPVSDQITAILLRLMREFSDEGARDTPASGA